MKLDLPGTVVPADGAVRRGRHWRTDWSPSLVALVYALGFVALVGALGGSMYFAIATFGVAGAAGATGAWLFGCVWFMSRTLVVSERYQARRTRPLAGRARREPM